MGGGSSSPPPAPVTHNYEETMREALQAQIDLAPQMYRAEANNSYGRPAYARLEQKIIHEGLTSRNGLIDNLAGRHKTTFSDGSYRKAGYSKGGTFMGTAQVEQDMLERAKNQQTRSELALIEKYGTKLTDAYRDQGDIREALDGYNELSDSKVSDDTWNELNNLQNREASSQDLFDGLIADANEGLELGGELSDRERRALEQESRQAMTARGRGRDFLGVVDEVSSKEEAMRARENERKLFASQVLGIADNAQQADRAFAGQRIGMQQADIQQQRAFAAQRVGIEQATSADPFMAITGRASGASVGSGQNLYGNAAQGINAGPTLYNPSQGAEFMANQSAALNNYNANVYSAQQQRKAGMFGGIMGAVGTIGGAALLGCWVAREVYGVHSPKWMVFRHWMLFLSPFWFRAIYLNFGERFAKFIKNKPRLKARIRAWMDTKIRETV
jgi:hypothetical protein